MLLFQKKNKSKFEKILNISKKNEKRAKKEKLDNEDSFSVASDKPQTKLEKRRERFQKKISKLIEKQQNQSPINDSPSNTMSKSRRERKKVLLASLKAKRLVIFCTSLHFFLPRLYEILFENVYEMLLRD